MGLGEGLVTGQHSDVTSCGVVQRFLMMPLPPTPRGLCPLLWEAGRPATLLEQARARFLLPSAQTPSLGGQTNSSGLEHLLSGDLVRVCHTFLLRLYFKMVKWGASENLSQVAELFQIKF